MLLRTKNVDGALGVAKAGGSKAGTGAMTAHCRQVKLGKLKLLLKLLG